MVVKPPMDSGVIAASVPPVSMMSAYPSRMWRNASPTALEPPAHAVTGQVHMPLKPNSMATSPAAMLEIPMGM